ncbi:uncharacterized protein FTOL_08873 [Fusarium torulosum]|uniref:Uncharacterized protein n=1 Tax=Fusarium torulosum TaxID=33205 RepID=A0AAE8SKK1_9HYPO|nr:uncharacterized protein FTOL_08873 [Fusarium torulosum]
MTGKPVYKPDEIRFALDLMVQDLFNEEISLAFQERFSRELTDNQIRYLRNKYGKDPDYGSPLVNRPANKKPKRRRAALAVASSASPPSEDSSRSFKRTRRERSETLAGPLYNPQKQLEAYSQSPPPKSEDKTFKSGDKAFKSEDTKSPSLSSTPLFRPTQTPTQTQLSNLRSPTLDSYTPTSAPTGFSPNAWQIQPMTTFTTNFTPINTQFGQYDAKAPGQGSPESKPIVPNQTYLHTSYTQPSYNVSSNQKPSYRSQAHSNIPVPVSQQSAVPPEESPRGQNPDPAAFGGDLDSLAWEEYVRPARSAAERKSSRSLLTQNVEAPDSQLHLAEVESPSHLASCEGDDHHHTARAPSHSVPETLQEDNANNDLNTIDPRLFDASYDPRFFIKKSPS